MRNRNTRGPASAAVKRTRTAAGSPSAGSFTSCDPTMRPSSLDVERHGLPGVPGLRDDGVGHERRALERRPRRGHAIDLDVAREPVAADADGEDRNGRRLQAEERLGQRGIGRVGAVADEHHAGQRQAGQLLARALERRAELGLRARERQLRRRAEPRRRRREAERAEDEALGERLDERRVLRAERLADERRRAAAVPQSAICMLRESSISTARKFCCGTAALTTRMGRNRQKSDDRERREAQRRQHDAIARPAAQGHAAVRDDGHQDRRDGHDAAAMYEPVDGARRNSPC